MPDRPDPESGLIEWPDDVIALLPHEAEACGWRLAAQMIEETEIDGRG